MDDTTVPEGPSPVRGHYRLTALERVSHGLFQPRVADEQPEEAFRRSLRAWLLVLPVGAAFTHLTGARLRGWRLPKLPEQVPVFAAVAGDPSRPRRSGLVCSRLRRTSEPAASGPHEGPPTTGSDAPAPDEARPELVHGLPVDSSEEILLRAARDLGVLDMVILIDSARRLGDVDEQRMAAVLQSGRPGVGVLRQAWELSDRRAESAMESVLRLFHVCIDVRVTPQAPLLDAQGQQFGRADLMVDGTDDIHEYDGGVHRDAGRHATDLVRERALAGRYVRRAWTLHELLNKALTVMHEIDRALARPHRPERIERWRHLVENSLYGATGRARVMNRWRRQARLNDWSQRT